MNKADLSPETVAVLERYRNGAQADLARQRRLSVQYGAAAGLIALASIVLQAPWLSIGVWGVFALWLVLRFKASQIQADAVAQALAELQES